jgi:exodeoxyribonuclease VII small subunit
MSKAAKSAGSASLSGDEMPFEQALQQLESIVDTMENDELSLEALLSRYEEGSNLAKVCQTRLAAAELKIQQLEKAAGGDLAARPVSFDVSAE